MNLTQQIIKTYKTNQRNEKLYILAEILTGVSIFALAFVYFSL
jgi:hypothetical protein